jgi:hypothetical protein
MSDLIGSAQGKTIVETARSAVQATRKSRFIPTFPIRGTTRLIVKTVDTGGFGLTTNPHWS